MKSEHSDTRNTYLTFRVVGDLLTPDAVTRALRVVPTVQYAKGETYFAGPRTGELVGKTGLWALTTDKLVASNNLRDHLAYLLGVLIPDRQDANPLFQLHALLAKRPDWRADLSCFWHGRPEAKKPSIPKFVSEVMKFLPAAIEADFATDSPTEREQRRA
ncbi:MAG TPA: DUF4279 domain-containing protein [Stellaceae bacterium]|jgi:hypothetical protein|nr:DUF4279 domain-containing protein [Stellaceae bacterium]